MEPDYGIVVVFEIPLEEVYFVDTNKLNENPIQKAYRDLIVEAIENEDEHGCKITVDDNIAISSGGYNDMHNALVELPCVVTHYLVVEVETE